MGLRCQEKSVSNKRSAKFSILKQTEGSFGSKFIAVFVWCLMLMQNEVSMIVIAQWHNSRLYTLFAHAPVVFFQSRSERACAIDPNSGPVAILFAWLTSFLHSVRPIFIYFQGCWRASSWFALFLSSETGMLSLPMASFCFSAGRLFLAFF